MSVNSLYSQTKNFVEPVIPFQTNSSPLFGKDIIINDKSYQDQRFEAICSAYNGWLYAVYSHPAADTNSWQILRSMDNGMTWSKFFSASVPLADSHATSFSIVACGNDLSTLKIFVSCIVTYSNVTETLFGVERFNGQTGDFEDLLLSNYNPVNAYPYGSIASDYQAPLNSATPYSIVILYTRTSLYPNVFRDSLIFQSSSDGGITLNNRKVVAIAKDYTHKFGTVSLAYGYSPVLGYGNYYATWEEKESNGASLGHIYTSHTTTGISSQFSTPLCLDSLDVASINRCRNPKISCQVNNMNNDSANLTEIVLYEKFLPGINNYDLIGCYNLQAVSSNHFNLFNLAISGDNEIQPDITFNPFDNNFFVTYYNSTLQKLPLLKNNFNMTTPDSWTVISNGYNDSSNLIAPNPKITINPVQHECANLWIAEQDNANGVAMFDAQYSTWTGLPATDQSTNNKLISVYPNPCNTSLNVSFSLTGAESVKITLDDLIGEPRVTITDQLYPEGLYNLPFDVSNLSPGSYLLNFRAGNLNKTCKVFIIR